MKYLNAINGYIFRLTGHRNFIITAKKHVAGLISYVYNSHLNIVDADKYDHRAFHEFSHFIEANDKNILLPNYGLEYGSSDAWEREAEVSKIETSLLSNTFFVGYVDKSYSYKSSVKPSFISQDILEAKIIHNVTLVKRFSHLSII